MTIAIRKAHEIASRAADLVGGDRDRQHGKKRQNFENIAAVWNAYLSIKEGTELAPLDAVDVGHMMVLLKIARTQSGAVNVDDYVDAAGYAACAGEVAQDYADPVDTAAQSAVEGRADAVRELRVGDRVRYINAGAGSLRSYIGGTGTLKDAGRGWVTVDWDSGLPGNAHSAEYVERIA